MPTINNNNNNNNSNNNNNNNINNNNNDNNNRFDRDKNGGGIMWYVREDIPNKAYAITFLQVKCFLLK